MPKKVPQKPVAEDEADDCGGCSTDDGLPQPSEPAMDALIFNVCADRGLILYGSLRAQATDPFLFDSAKET